MKFPTEQHLQDLTKDKFGFHALSKLLLDDVILQMESPNCFGLYGNWGSGKSTMLRYIQDHLIKGASGDYKDYVFVHFDAWKYEYSKDNDLLFALLNSIKKEGGIKEDEWKELMINIASVGSGLMRAAGLPGAGDVAGDTSALEEDILKDHERWVDRIDELHEDFDTIVARILNKKKRKRLIVFVDDLDRCLPENAVKLLEGIRHFLLVPSTLFVLAIDRRIISEMVGKKYGLHDGYGDEYLLKIIHYYYELPTLGLMDTIQEVLILHGLNPTERQIGYIAEFLKQEAKEPRAAKHLLHRVGMCVHLSSEAQASITADETATRIQYVFVAAFLLTRYSKIFSSGNPTPLLQNIRQGTAYRGSGDRQNDYDRIKKAYPLDAKTRHDLENVMLHPISVGREASPPRFIDTEQLGIAIMQLR